MKYLFRLFSPRKLSYVLIIFFVFMWMRHWFGPGIPANPREENIIDISWLWTLYKSRSQNILAAPWNPLSLTGNTNILQRGYFLFAPLAIIISKVKAPVEIVYVFTVSLTFIIAGIGIYEYLRLLRISSYGALLGALSYMLLPPHLTLGLDALDFNAYWALIPFLCILIVLYIRSDKALLSGTLMGVLLTLSLMTGTTYFIATLPFLSIFWGLQIYMARRNSAKSIIKFLGISLVFFLGTAAYILIPTLTEYMYMWISQESQRKNIFNILSLGEILESYLLRIKGHSVLDWVFDRNHPDLGFYLGWSVSSLALISVVQIRQKFKKIFPFLFLLGVFLGFVSLRLQGAHLALTSLVRFVLSLNLQSKIVISLTLVSLSIIFFLIYHWKTKKKITFSQLLIGMLILTVVLVFILNIYKFQAIYDHTVRVFLFPTFAFSILAGFGLDSILKRFVKKWHLLLSIIIIVLVLIDLYPFSQFFKNIPVSITPEDKKVYDAINFDTTGGRYLSPFPFKRHLPKYRYEYFAHFVNKWRLNNENVYTPFTPLYSTHLYDILLVGALEEEIDPNFFLTILDWGNTNYVVFRHEVANYSNITETMRKKGWNVLAQSQNVTALINSKPSPFIHLYPNFIPAPAEKRTDPFFWYQSSLPTMSMYEDIDGQIEVSELEGNFKQSDLKLMSWERVSASEITTLVDVPTRSLLVASEAWFPGWQVTIDTKPAPILRANYASLGVVIPPGIHAVNFMYVQPWYYKYGQLITIISLLLATIPLWYSLERKLCFVSKLKTKLN